MDVFLPNEYIEKFIQTNRAERTQMEVFFEFISTHLFNGEDYVVDDFAFLNETDLLESLNYYIKRNKVTAKVTAKAYIGNLRKFFAVLENQYNVHSDIFVNGDFLPSLLEKTNQIVSLLNDKENSNIASDEKYSEFLQKIEEIQSKYSYLEAIKEIDNYVKTKTIPNHFRWIISVCASQMVIEYGFRNSVIISLKLNDIDLEQNVIKRGKYTLPILPKLKNDLSKYIEIRQYLLNKLNLDYDELFIKYNGKPISGSEAADKLFSGILGENESKASKLFAQKCVERMIDAGFNFKLIEEITGYKESVYNDTCKYIDENNPLNNQNRINNFVVQERNNVSRKIGYMDCPICGKKGIKATSDNFVLIKYPKDNELHIACKECGEKEQRKFNK